MVDHIFNTEYHGWDIGIHCLARLHADGDAPRQQRYTATAHATLTEQSESGDLWIDARAQVVTLGNRHFPSPQESIDALLTDVRELIDALKM